MMIPESLDVTLALYQEFSNGESVLSNHRSLNVRNRSIVSTHTTHCRDEIDQWQSLRSSFKTTSNDVNHENSTLLFKFLRSMRPSICVLFFPQ